MKHQFILCYSDVFPGTTIPDDAIAVLKENPTRNVLECFCYINSLLHLNPYSTQKSLLDFFAVGQKAELTFPLSIARQHQLDQYKGLYVFDLSVTLINIGQLLKNCEIKDTGAKITKEERRTVLMATLISNEAYNKKREKRKDATDLETFCQFWWPNMLKGSMHLNRGNFITHSYKSGEFMEYLTENPNIGKHFKSYFGMSENTDLLRFSNSLLNAYINLGMNRSTGKFFFGMNLPVEDNPALKMFVLNISKLDTTKFVNEDHKTLRSYPILKVADQRYMIVNWNFILDKMDNAVIFDLYNNTDLRNQMPFQQFKGDLGYQFAERLFQRLATTLLVKSGDIHKIGDPNRNDNQDYYLRRKKRIILFEFKDILMKKEVEYDKIKKQLDDNLVKGKGVGQLVALMDKMKQDLNVFEPGLSKVVNPKRLVIYPVIVVTEPLYSIPGMSQYLHKQMKKQMESKVYPFYVKPLVIVDLDFFMDYYDGFKTGQTDFFNILEVHFKRALRYRQMKVQPYDDRGLWAKRFNAFRENVWTHLPQLYNPKKVSRPGTFANITATRLKMAKK